MVEMGIIYEIKHFITLTLLIQTCWMKLMYRNSKTDYMWWVSHLVGVASVGVTFGGCCEIHKLLSDSKVGLKTAYPTVQHNEQSKNGQRLNTRMPV